MGYQWDFTLIEGKLHKGGVLKLNFIGDEPCSGFKMKMEYEVEIKGFLPIPKNYRKGTFEFNIAGNILDPAMWYSIKKNPGRQKIEKVYFEYGGQKDHLDLFHLSHDEGFITGEIYLKPDDMEKGPKRMCISLDGIPLLNNYQLELYSLRVD